MKRVLSAAFILCFAASFTQAQFQRLPTKTAAPATQKKTVPTMVDGPKIIGTVIQPAAGSFNNPSQQFTLPDGKRVTMTMRQNPPNLPTNFGGVVKENVESTNRSSDNNFDYTTEVKTITAQSSSFMNVNYNQQAIHIYPGAIYTFSDFFSGKFRAIEQGRNAINISTDNLANSTGSVFETVQTPTADNIRTKIATIIRPFSTTAGSSGIQYRVFTSDNDADMSIKLSAGGGYAGFKASGGYTNQQTEKKYNLTIDAIKPMYTLITSMPANGYFMDKNVEAANPNLIVLKSVTYGTRVLANLEITISKQSDDINFKASFGADSGKGVSANAFAMFNYLKTNTTTTSTANAYIVGGPINVTIFDKDKLLEQITDMISRCNYQTAQPIAYSFTDINGNILGVETATDKFTVSRATPKSSVFKLSGIAVQIQTGKDNKEQGSSAAVYLTNSNNVIVYESASNNVEFTGRNEIALTPISGMPDNQLLESSFTKNGGYIDIFLNPKPIFLDFDQWDIAGVYVTLYFTDQNNSTITRVLDFNSAKVKLQKNQQRLRLPFNSQYVAGGAFMPGL